MSDPFVNVANKSLFEVCTPARYVQRIDNSKRINYTFCSSTAVGSDMNRRGWTLMISTSLYLRPLSKLVRTSRGPIECTGMPSLNDGVRKCVKLPETVMDI
eukprot:3966288-Pyramimonas_sp.AAC.1